MQEQRARHGTNQQRDRWNRADLEQLVEPAMERVGSPKLVTCRSLVRVDDDGGRHVLEPEAGQEHLFRPLEIFRNRRRPERNTGPDGSSNARANVVKGRSTQSIQWLESGKCLARDRQK